MISWAATQTLPIPGVTSGMMSSGMNYDALPANAVVNGTSYSMSPLQQWILPRPEKLGPAGFEVGAPVQIIHLTSPQAAKYNDMIGDIIAVKPIENPDGTSDLHFDVRCPIAPEDLQSPDDTGRFVRDQQFFGTKMSTIAHGAAT